MPKAPPRPYTPPQALPKAVRVYGHIHGGFDVACPACGMMHAIGMRTGKRRYVKHHAQRGGYDSLSGALVCRGCGRTWYVGLVLWPVASRGRSRPADHVPTVGEAHALREAYGSWGKGDAERKPGRGSINLVCWCGMDCPAHPAEGDVIE